MFYLVARHKLNVYSFTRKTYTSHAKISLSSKTFLIKGKSFINILQLIILYMKQKRDERINFRNIGSQIKYLAKSFVLLNVHTIHCPKTIIIKAKLLIKLLILYDCL